MLCSPYILPAAGFDYLPFGDQLQFVLSGNPIQCVEIQLVDDHLAEEREWFGVQLSTDTTAAEVVNSQLRLVIEPSDGEGQECIF